MGRDVNIVVGRLGGALVAPTETFTILYRESRGVGWGLAMIVIAYLPLAVVCGELAYIATAFIRAFAVLKFITPLEWVARIEPASAYFAAAVVSLLSLIVVFAVYTLFVHLVASSLFRLHGSLGKCFALLATAQLPYSLLAIPLFLGAVDALHFFAAAVALLLVALIAFLWSIILCVKAIEIAYSTTGGKAFAVLVLAAVLNIVVLSGAAYVLSKLSTVPG